MNLHLEHTPAGVDGLLARAIAEVPSPEGLPTGKGRLLALDIDGVLIHPGRSFHEAVTRALAERAPDLPWSDAHFESFKRIGGFNNDFRLAAAALVLWQAGRLDEVLERPEGGWPALEAAFQALEPLVQVDVQRHYAQTKAMERPAVTLAQLQALPCHLAILTGRPPEELVLAFEVMGYELPAICDAAPHLRKPEPAGLLALARTFGCDEVVFVGDTPDDAACLRRARALAPDVRWVFAGVGPHREGFLAPEDLAAEGLEALLPLLREGGVWHHGGQETAHDRLRACRPDA